MTCKKVLIIGRDLKYSYEKLKSSYDCDDCLIIGDGERPIKMYEIQNSLGGKIDSNTRIVIHAHGSIKINGDYSIDIFDHSLTNYYNINNLMIELFLASRGVPLQVELHSCYSGASKDKVKLLPEGSVLTMYVSGDKKCLVSESEFKIQNNLQAHKENPSLSPVEMFNKNFAANLSSSGALSIAVNVNGKSKNISFVADSDKLKDGVSNYFLTSANQLTSFHKEVQAEICNNSPFTFTTKYFQKNGENFINDNNIFADSKCIESLLMNASYLGELEKVQLLLQYDINVNVKNDYGFTPLHYAVLFGHKRVVEVLINQGANQHLAANNGDTPIKLALNANNKEIVELLQNSELKEKFTDVSEKAIPYEDNSGQVLVPNLFYSDGKINLGSFSTDDFN